MSENTERWCKSAFVGRFNVFDTEHDGPGRWLDGRGGDGVMYEMVDGIITGVSIQLTMLKTDIANERHGHTKGGI